MATITKKDLFEIRQFLIPRWTEKQSEISARKGLLRDLRDSYGMVEAITRLAKRHVARIKNVRV